MSAGELLLEVLVGAAIGCLQTSAVRRHHLAAIRFLGSYPEMAVSVEPRVTKADWKLIDDANLAIADSTAAIASLEEALSKS